jgi:TRAP-type C4-dicarboxylate transport system permease small subunit
MKMEKLIDNGIPILCGILLVVIVLLVSLRIVLREFFNVGLSWSDEITQFSMTWIVLFGSIWATKNDKHLNANIKFQNKLNKRQIKLIDGILALVIVFTSAVIAYRSAIYSFRAMRFTALSLEWLKMGFVFIPLPLAMLALCYYYLRNFINNLALIFRKE